MAEKKYIQGTPVEVGAQIFEKFCLPALKATEGRPANEIKQLYAGFLSAVMGSMAADFGHAHAVQLVDVIADSFSKLGDQLTPPAPH